MDDALRYTTASANLSNLPKNEITVIDYFTIAEMTHADTWQYPFNYQIHHLGFRFNELPKEVDIAVFGCSFTFGIGLPNEMLWHSILSKELGTTCINFGLPGSSIKTAIDLFLIASKHIKIKKAIFLLPSASRMQIAKQHPTLNETHLLSIIAGYDSKMSAYYQMNDSAIYRAIPDEERYKIIKEAIYLSEYIAKDRQVDVYYSSWEIETYQFLQNMNLTYGVVLPDWRSSTPELGKTDLARDRLHPGPKHHIDWATNIKEFIK